MQFIVLLIVSLSFSPFSTLVQDSCSYLLSGYVIDEHDRLPLSKSKIYVKEPRREVFADSSGYFVFPDLCKGTYDFYCKHIGCDAVKRSITIQGNTKQNFYPEHHVDFDAVDVVAKKTISVLGNTLKIASEKPLRLSVQAIKIS